jgi:hypothetical protein
MNTQDNPAVEPQGLPGPQLQGFQVPEQQGFTTEDILWAVGIWSVILCLSPVIVFYMLIVA